jgi:transposase
MQSTGVYWIPLYDILEERGFEVYLVNARHTKNLPGRKSDVQECQWLLKLHIVRIVKQLFRLRPRLLHVVMKLNNAVRKFLQGY